jgi:hypothetical protein
LGSVLRIRVHYHKKADFVGLKINKPKPSRGYLKSNGKLAGNPGKGTGPVSF